MSLIHIGVYVDALNGSKSDGKIDHVANMNIARKYGLANVK